MTEFEKWLLFATAIGTGISLFTAFVKPFIKKEKLTAVVTKFYVDEQKDKNGNRIWGNKMAQILLTFKNCGNQQATITKFKFIYTAVEKIGKHETEFESENFEFNVPKVIIPGETFPYKYEEKINFEELRNTKTITVIDQEKQHEIVKIGMRILFLKSNGEQIARTYEIAEIKNSPQAMSFASYIENFEISLFKNKYKRIRTKKKDLNFCPDPLF